MLNTVSLQGRFTKDPDFKKTQNNISLVYFNLAVNQYNKTVYIPCVAWRELAETIDRYFKKGQMCVIIGELSSRLITTRDSVDRPQRYTKIEVIVHKIFFVDRNDKPEVNEPMEDWQKPEAEEQKYWDDDEDDIPF